MQKPSEGHEIAETDDVCPAGTTRWSIDHGPPRETRTSPSTSGATQKRADAQATFVMPSFGAGQRTRSAEDHEEPFQTNASPPTATARQKLAEGQEMWFTVSPVRGCGFDHEPSLKTIASPAPGLEATATQKRADAQETDAKPRAEEIRRAADQCHRGALLRAAEVVVPGVPDGGGATGDEPCPHPPAMALSATATATSPTERKDALRVSVSRIGQPYNGRRALPSS
jgi:hypothetical protein